MSSSACQGPSTISVPMCHSLFSSYWSPKIDQCLRSSTEQGHRDQSGLRGEYTWMPSSSGEPPVREAGHWTHGGTEYKITQHLLRLGQRVANHRPSLQRTTSPRRAALMMAPGLASLRKAPQSGEDSPAGQGQLGPQTRWASAGSRALD